MMKKQLKIEQLDISTLFEQEKEIFVPEDNRKVNNKNDNLNKPIIGKKTIFLSI